MRGIFVILFALIVNFLGSESSKSPQVLIYKEEDTDKDDPRIELLDLGDMEARLNTENVDRLKYTKHYKDEQDNIGQQEYTDQQQYDNYKYQQNKKNDYKARHRVRPQRYKNSANENTYSQRGKRNRPQKYKSQFLSYKRPLQSYKREKVNDRSNEQLFDKDVKDKYFYFDSDSLEYRLLQSDSSNKPKNNWYSKDDDDAIREHKTFSEDYFDTSAADKETQVKSDLKRTKKPKAKFDDYLDLLFDVDRENHATFKQQRHKPISDDYYEFLFGYDSGLGKRNVLLPASDTQKRKKKEEKLNLLSKIKYLVKRLMRLDKDDNNENREREVVLL